MKNEHYTTENEDKSRLITKNYKAEISLFSSIDSIPQPRGHITD